MHQFNIDLILSYDTSLSKSFPINHTIPPTEQKIISPLMRFFTVIQLSPINILRRILKYQPSSVRLARRNLQLKIAYTLLGINLLSYLYFPPSSHLIHVCFCPVGLSGQETEVTSTPTRPVENFITTKGLQDRNIYQMGRRWKIKVKQ